MLGLLCGTAVVLLSGVVLPMTAMFIDIKYIPEPIQGHALSSDSCCAGSGLSVFLTASLNVCFATIALHSTVLPNVFPGWNDLGNGDKMQAYSKKRKIVMMVVALLLRGVCCVGMWEVWNFLDWDNGLEFQALTGSLLGPECDISSPDVRAVRSFYLVRVWLAALMVWELAYLPTLFWDDYLHHFLVMVFCILSTDPAFGGGNLSPLMQACAMSLLLGASIASLNYAFLLLFHATPKHPLFQSVLIFTSALFSWTWQSACFLYIPFRLILVHPVSYEACFSGFCAVFLFIIDSKANLTRIAIAKAKWDKAAKLKTA
eukprot:TRINITY_DN17592_c0_g1_i1.p1 TRINITY_DN17592_c0_g1~~TRINITY_DN17592_c0_g1_i1.p1  ORF type:complete len:334 (+),score=31.79 TRINITY_DN17592_c0_g1_i1:55-1002(+)